PDARQWLTLVDFGLCKSLRCLRQRRVTDRQPEQDERRRQRMVLRDAPLELARERGGALPVACHHVAIDELAERAGVLRVERAHALKACDRLLEALELQEDCAAGMQRVAIPLIERERAIIGCNRFGVSP